MTDTKTYSSRGVVVNSFTEAARRGQYASQLAFAASHGLCGYRVRFDEDGPLQYTAADVSVSLAEKAIDLEGRRVDCDWIVRDGRLAVVTHLQIAPAPVPEGAA